MKRKHVECRENKYHSYTTKPWFIWRVCSMCGYDFRREPVHVIEKTYYIKEENGRRIIGHNKEIFQFCTGCMPTLKQAEKYFESEHLYKYIM